MLLRDIFLGGTFAPPATPQQISDVERSLDVRFPEQLKALYRQCNGFQEPRGRAGYLAPLLPPQGEEDSITSLYTLTRFYWDQWESISSYALGFEKFIFFGNSGADEAWGISHAGPTQVIAFHYHMGAEYEVVGTDIIQVMRKDFSEYPAH
jgi:hypothetical protein